MLRQNLFLKFVMLVNRCCCVTEQVLWKILIERSISVHTLHICILIEPTCTLQWKIILVPRRTTQQVWADCQFFLRGILLFSYWLLAILFAKCVVVITNQTAHIQDIMLLGIFSHFHHITCITEIKIYSSIGCPIYWNIQFSKLRPHIPFCVTRHIGPIRHILLNITLLIKVIFNFNLVF